VNLGLIRRLAYFFLGVDSAPAQQSRSDRGALVIGRATPAVAEPAENESDWKFDLVWARMARSMSARQYSGLIHAKERDFGLAKIVMDHGGGGQWIERELRVPRQIIDGIEQDVTPITRADDVEAAVSKHILHLLYRGDEGLKKMFPDLKNAQGDDVLKTIINMAFRNAIEKAQIGFMPPHHERTAEQLAGWPEEKQWASKLLTVVGKQCQSVSVATKEDGSWATTRHGAYVFVSQGKDDFHDAARNAYIAFRMWLIDQEAGWDMADADAGLCGGWAKKG